MFISERKWFGRKQNQIGIALNSHFLYNNFWIAFFSIFVNIIKIIEFQHFIDERIISCNHIRISPNKVSNFLFRFISNKLLKISKCKIDFIDPFMGFDSFIKKLPKIFYHFQIIIYSNNISYPYRTNFRKFFNNFFGIFFFVGNDNIGLQ